MIDALSMLALKVAPNVFDLSSQLVHVSMRDQVVRARLLVRDLALSELPCKQILIVGAGIAGISAAAAAAARGIEVLVVDTAAMPMSLQATVTSRWVGPFMYEWPLAHAGNQDYPPHDPQLWDSPDGDTPAWSQADPVPSDVLGRDVRTWLTNYLSRSWKTSQKKPKFLMNVKPSQVGHYVKNVFSAPRGPAAPFFGTDWPLGIDDSVMFEPDFVLLAAGMGKEDVELTKGGFSGLPFWSNDDLKHPVVERQQTAVFGGGDGALQDVFRALTTFHHPLLLMNQLQKGASGHALQGLIPGLIVIEEQSRLLGAWTTSKDKWSLLDEKCSDFAKTFAANADAVRKVASAVRSGTGEVHLFLRGNGFTKAYLLNRFIIYLIEHMMAASPSSFTNKMTLKIVRNVNAVSSSPKKAGIIQFSTRPTNGGGVLKAHQFDRVVVRFGIAEGTIPGLQMISLTPSPPAHRTTLAQVPLPFVV